jgi:hypothetical protein
VTDQIKSLPAQNCALLEESDAIEFPGIHAADHVNEIPGMISDQHAPER